MKLGKIDKVQDLIYVAPNEPFFDIQMIIEACR